MRSFIPVTLASLLALVGGACAASLDTGWRFQRSDAVGFAAPGFDDRAWESVTLPHTARVEALVAGTNAPQWQGVCWYRNHFFVPASASNQVAILRFEGAMNTADIRVNGREAGKFMGGYLPYVMDISRLLVPGATNLIAVRLDNRDNPLTGPKPLADLDFNLYGGLYRGASLTFKDALHITDPILANETAGGGVFVTIPAISREAATVRVQTQVRNAGAQSRAFVIQTTVQDADGKTVASQTTAVTNLSAGSTRATVMDLAVKDPHLWSPATPYLYRVRCDVMADGRIVDHEQVRTGIRRIEITRDGFRINGEKMFLRGANRHQEYPYIGNALPDAAQYRDARTIKEAGFDYVRLSHYPQSPAFLDACDELGIVVMNCLMGWQYFNRDPAFATLKLRECRDMVRRDRNHPCVILWEVALNESDMPSGFREQAHRAAHEEYPGDQCYTCGWQKGYDVFIQARQHGGCHGVTNQPCVVSEYGDWEYFAQNAGLAQNLWKDLKPAERSSRQFRGDGERRLLQQALNFQEAHNDNLSTPAFADGIWVMFDYNRGYAPDIEASGVMDIFRLPKPGYWFFRSQRDASENIAGQPCGPVVHIASQAMPGSSGEIRVFSNCDEVELFRNGEKVARQRPDQDRISTRLRHPPFTFRAGAFDLAILRAVGFKDGREVASHEVCTPGNAATLKLAFDLAGKPFAATGRDAVFCHAWLRDPAGTVVLINGVPVSFGKTGAVRLTGQNPIAAEAGAASILLESDEAEPSCAVFALGIAKDGDKIHVLAAGARPDGAACPRFSVHYTSDGSEPDAGSPVYEKPLKEGLPVRAALVVDGAVVATASAM